jgi:hypothetical protein
MRVIDGRGARRVRSRSLSSRPDRLARRNDRGAPERAETVEAVLDWVDAAGHGLIGLYARHGYEEVIVEIRH